MENKVLVKLIVSEISQTFDVFIPINEIVWKIKKMLVKSVVDITDTTLNLNDNYILINKSTGRIYKNNDIIVDTDIRNTTELMLVSKV